MNSFCQCMELLPLIPRRCPAAPPAAAAYITGQTYAIDGGMTMQ